MTEENWLKGDDFVNRYRIEGRLTTASPFHLGSGYTCDRKGLKKKENENEVLVKISAVALDWEDRPVIPGSSLKGALRGFLLDVLSASTRGRALLAAQADYDRMVRQQGEAGKTPRQSQAEQIRYMKTEASVLERLFGTPFTEGKIEVQDGECSTEKVAVRPELANPERAPYWHPERLTYVDQSVAIDPETRTAIDKKLYHYEVVPPGISFGAVITGQNLSRMELGMLLFGLGAFNSEIWPLTLGAMAGRGFGRFVFEMKEIRHLPKSGIDNWIQNAAQSPDAGYETLPLVPGAEQERLLADFRNAFLEGLGGAK